MKTAVKAIMKEVTILMLADAGAAGCLTLNFPGSRDTNITLLF